MVSRFYDKRTRLFLCLFKRKINERRFSRTDWRINFFPSLPCCFFEKVVKTNPPKNKSPSSLSVYIQTDSRRTSTLAAAAFQLPSDISCNTFLLPGMQHQEIDYKYLITKKSERAREVAVRNWINRDNSAPDDSRRAKLSSSRLFSLRSILLYVTSEK